MRLLANLAWLLTMGEVDLMPVAPRQLPWERALVDYVFQGGCSSDMLLSYVALHGFVL